MVTAAVVMVTAAALAARLSATAGGAGAPSSGPAMGMPGCETSCGNVSVPYPFGMGPASCYVSGFNLTCDQSSNPPRLLLGEEEDTFRVIEITLWSSTVRVVRTGAILNGTSHGKNTTSDAGFSVPGGKDSPYMLSRGNELVLTGCNAVAVLLYGGAADRKVISGCASFCESAGLYDPVRTGRGVDHQANGDKYCSGNGCCQAPIYAGDVTDMGLQFSWLNGVYHQSDMSTLPSYVFIAEEGWFDQRWVADQVLNSSLPPSRAALEVPIILDWSFNFSEIGRSMCRSKHSFAFETTCACWFGHDGNPYLTDGCIDVDECEEPEEYGCFGQCTNLPGTFDCRCPPGSHGNHTVPGGCVKSITEGNLSHILDPQVMDTEGKVVEEVAKLALACVKLTGEDRPTMRNVELTLESLKASKRHILGEEDGTAMSGLTSTCVQNRKESSRQYSMEEEFVLSSRYPR